MLPLDLHVLSLSLAFILSQDQTLHCWNKFVCCSFSSKIRSIVFDLFLSKHWRGNVGYLSYPIFPCTTCQSLIVLRSICLWSRCCPLLLQSDCKGTKIFYSRNRWGKKKTSHPNYFFPIRLLPTVVDIKQNIWLLETKKIQYQTHKKIK